jgi:hypothetical protein
MEGEERLQVELMLRRKSSVVVRGLCLDCLFFGNLAFATCNLSGYLLHGLYFYQDFPTALLRRSPEYGSSVFDLLFWFFFYSESFLVRFPSWNLFLIPPVERQFISIHFNSITHSTSNPIFPIC